MLAASVALICATVPVRVTDAAAIAADAGAAQPAHNIVRHRQCAAEHRQRRGDVAVGVRIADRDAADRRADALGRTHRHGRHRVAGVVDLGDVDRHRAGGGERRALVLRRHRQRVAAVVALLQVSQAVAGGQRRIDLRTVPVRVTEPLPLPPMPAPLSPPATLFATVSVPLSTDSVVVTLPLASGSLIAMPLIAVPTPSVALTGTVGTVLLASLISVTLIATVLVAVNAVPWSCVATVSVSLL